jgi:hypothetical protein
MSSKRLIIEKAEKFLAESGFANTDYVMSLQGPTVIFTQTGLEKFNNDIILRADLMDLGIIIL